MNRKPIPENVKRRLWAESMGRCMNPACRENLFIDDNDIMEKAHINAYFETEDNSYENLIILCPNCHKKFDKTNQISIQTVKEWKKIRREELERFFSIKFKSFDRLKEKVEPILRENYDIYKNYYLNANKTLWKKFEPKILVNNEILKSLFKNNYNLFQDHPNKDYSNLEVIQTFITHVNEFKNTRGDEEKQRQVLFPQEINSIFGITPVSGSIILVAESLEELIKALRKKGRFESIMLGIDKPYILLKSGEKIFVDDIPRLRQLYFNNYCFRKTGVRLQNLNFALSCLKSRNVPFSYTNPNSLREIEVNGTKIIFVYKYCLSKAFLFRMNPESGCIVVNLYNWNGEACISQEALNFAASLDTRLFTIEDFFKYINEIRKK